MDVLATLQAIVGAEISGFMTGMKTVKETIGGVGGTIGSIGDKISGLGGQLTLLTAPLTAAFGVGIKVASDFEGTMAELRARTGLAGEEFQKVTDFVLDMGAKTAFSGQEAAQGMLELLSSGQNIKEAMATLPAVLDAAAAGGLQLGHTADLITNVMASFNLEVKDARMVVDALAAAAGASSADINSLGQGFSNVGGVARKFGLSVEDTAAILAIFAENGIAGAEAGTQIKSMLLNMTRPTEKVQAAWKKLGTSLYDAKGNLRPLNQVLKEVGNALKKLPVQEQNELLQELGGSYGILGLTALTSGMSIDQMRQRMNEQASATDVAKARLDTFGGAMESLKGGLETLMITALTPLIKNVLTPLAQDLTKIVNGIISWANANPAAAETLAKIGVAAIVAGPAVTILGGAFKVLGTLMSPPMLLLGAIIALLTWASDKFGGLDKMMRDASDTADKILKISLYAIFDVLNKASTAATQLGIILGLGLKSVVEWVTTAFWKVVDAVSGVVDFFKRAFTAGVQLAIIIASALMPVVSTITTFFRNLFGAVRDVITKVEEFFNLLKKNRSELPGGKTLLESILPGFKNPFVQDDQKGGIDPFNPFKAKGGPVSSGRSYIVGERGAGWPNRNGYIVPNNALGGGGGRLLPVTIVLKADNFEDRIYANVAVALEQSS